MVLLPDDFHASERANTILYQPDGGGFAAWLNTGTLDVRLEVTHTLGNYPALNVKVVERTDEELLAHIRTLHGWEVGKVNLHGGHTLQSGSVIPYPDDE